MVGGQDINQSSDENTLLAKGAFAAIGNFDGVHLGHQALIADVIKVASQLGRQAGAVVFDPHPRAFFRPNDPSFLLTTPDDRDALIKFFGVPHVYRLEFNAPMAAMSPEEFVVDVLKGELGLAGVATGADFRFGKARAGDAAMLDALCKANGMDMRIIDPIAPRESGANGKIGSSGVRAALGEGDVAAAAKLLGRDWSVSGIVQEGRQLGRTLDFPTANLTLGQLIAPRHGVYAVKIDLGAERFDGVANFGRRPTVDDGAPLLEVFLFDFNRDLYGQKIRVSFVDFIRPEKKFDGLDSLKAQIAADCLTARTIHARQ